jgi:hypothetical protein
VTRSYIRRYPIPHGADQSRIDRKANNNTITSIVDHLIVTAHLLSGWRRKTGGMDYILSLSLDEQYTQACDLTASMAILSSHHLGKIEA